KALYFLTNNDDENSVACVEVGSDGKVTGRGSVVKTSGKGSSGLNWETNQPASSESLFSQSSITVCDDHVFVVNPGSNTLSMLSIDAANPINLQLVGQPVKLPGEFPNTVTASSKHKMVCVGMTGAKAGISCMPYAPGAGLGSSSSTTASSSWREFKLEQTTPPTGPYNTLSQVMFSDDEEQLYATVKGDPRSGKQGWFSSYDVRRNASAAWLSEQEVRSKPQGTSEMGGCAAIPGSKDVLVADSSFGVAVLGLSGRSEASVMSRVDVKDQQRMSHVALKAGSRTAWVSDAARNRVVEVSYERREKVEITAEVDLQATGDFGFADLKAGGDFLYALSPGDGRSDCGITVVNSKDKKLVQRAGLSGVGANKSSMGMAV
ncbi:hypothetical protein QBC42DRAFT_331134, partial [Cladorrhinum samala]